MEGQISALHFADVKHISPIMICLTGNIDIRGGGDLTGAPVLYRIIDLSLTNQQWQDKEAVVQVDFDD